MKHTPIQTMMIYGDCGEEIVVTNVDLKLMIGNQFDGTSVPDIFFELALQFISSFYRREIGDHHSLLSNRNQYHDYQ